MKNRKERKQCHPVRKLSSCLIPPQRMHEMLPYPRQLRTIHHVRAMDVPRLSLSVCLSLAIDSSPGRIRSKEYGTHMLRSSHARAKKKSNTLSDEKRRLQGYFLKKRIIRSTTITTTSNFCCTLLPLSLSLLPPSRPPFPIIAPSLFYLVSPSQLH